MAKIKQITIPQEKIEGRSIEGIYLIDSKWIHLDSQEVQNKISKGEQIFKINTKKLI